MGRPMLNDKQCSRCRERKPKSEFYGKTRKSGHCKQCQALAQSERRKYIVEYLSNHPCIDCGEDDVIVLEFDHEDQGAKAYTISRMVRNNFSLERLQHEIDKCVVRCANCHRRRTAKQCGWIHRVQ